MQARILDGFDKKYHGVAVRPVNVMEDRDISQRYKVKVVPTLVFLDPKGNSLYRHEGVMTEEQLLAKWKELGYDAKGPSRTE